MRKREPLKALRVSCVGAILPPAPSVFSVLCRWSHLLRGGVRRDADAGGVALGLPPRQPLVQLLRDEGHEGRQEAQAHLQARVKGLSAHSGLSLTAAVFLCFDEHWFHAFLERRRRERNRLIPALVASFSEHYKRFAFVFHAFFSLFFFLSECSGRLLPSRRHTARTARSCRWRL